MSSHSKLLGFPCALGSSMSRGGNGGSSLGLEPKSIRASSSYVLINWFQTLVWVGCVKGGENGWSITVDGDPLGLVGVTEVHVGDVSAFNTGDSCSGRSDLHDFVKIALSDLLAGDLEEEIGLVAEDDGCSGSDPGVECCYESRIGSSECCWIAGSVNPSCCGNDGGSP